MTFNSLQYLLFLPLVWLIHYWSPDRCRWLMLLAASLLFYAAVGAPYLLLVLGAVALCSYLCARVMTSCPEGRRRTGIFWFAVVGNVLLLTTLKTLPLLSPGKQILVTLGVSYYAFQAIAYLVDVYLEVLPPERHFGIFFLSLAFFPKLLQGPIERGGDFLPQLRQPYAFDYENMRSGLLLFAWGLFKKVVVADRLALYVNAVYGDVHSYAGIPLLLATYLFALQILFDFSGYTDMALGAARLFNLRLTPNFSRPYFARSVAEFWRCWHISFSRWILDYIFKPLQMHWRSWGTVGTAVALLVTFLISGLWHGISWGYVVWGGLHGIYLAISVYYKPFQKKIHAFLGLTKTKGLAIWQTLFTFHLVCFAWIFFRAASLQDGIYVVRAMGKLFDPEMSLGALTAGLPKDSLSRMFVVVVGAVLVGLLFSEKMKERVMQSTLLRWSYYYLLVASIIMFGVFEKSQFIYFQF